MRGGGGGAEWESAGVLLVNRSLLGRLFAPTKNKKLHDILTCSTYVVDPSRLLGCLVRISGFRQGGKGVQSICSGVLDGWDQPKLTRIMNIAIICTQQQFVGEEGIEWIWMDVVEEEAIVRGVTPLLSFLVMDGLSHAGVVFVAVASLFVPPLTPTHAPFFPFVISASAQVLSFSLTHSLNFPLRASLTLVPTPIFPLSPFLHSMALHSMT